MTKADALKIVKINSRGSKNFHKDQARFWLANAESLQQSFKIAKTDSERKSTESYYIKALEKADAHLTMIDK